MTAHLKSQLSSALSFSLVPKIWSVNLKNVKIMLSVSSVVLPDLTTCLRSFVLYTSWLSVESRFQCKNPPLTSKSMNNHAPSYISDLIQHYAPSRQLRSSADTRLPSAHLKSSGRRAFFLILFLYFYNQSPLLWNSLPYSLRQSSSTAASNPPSIPVFSPLGSECLACVCVCGCVDCCCCRCVCVGG